MLTERRPLPLYAYWPGLWGFYCHTGKAIKGSGNNKAAAKRQARSIGNNSMKETGDPITVLLPADLTVLHKLLTATSRSYGKAKNSTPHRIETPDLIGIKFGTVDYVGEVTPGAKLHANPSMGGFSANGWNIRKFFYLHIYIPGGPKKNVPNFRMALCNKSAEKQTSSNMSFSWRSVRE